MTTTARRTSTIRPFARPRLMTRDEFEHWAIENHIRLMVPAPYRLVPCACGDINCHGWRFVRGADA